MKSFWEKPFVDFVKSLYAPSEKWRSKPFGETDLRFFAKGVLELSDLFTDEREYLPPDYLSHAKYRSSYLLYFLILNTEKIKTLAHQHPLAIEAFLKDSAENHGGLWRWTDLGSGPGSASLAWLITLWESTPKEFVPSAIEVILVDQQPKILLDAEKLLKLWVELHAPEWLPRLKVVRRPGDWRRYRAGSDGKSGIVFFANVLNEGSEPTGRVEGWVPHVGAGGILCIEPSTRRSAKGFGEMRTTLLEKGLGIWGPCLHSGTCPLLEGRDWCHFSSPGRIESRWFEALSKQLGSVREWFKYTYLWVGPGAQPVAGASSRRIVSDPIPAKTGGGRADLLVCEPEQVQRIQVTMQSPFRRGMLWSVNKK